MDVLKHSETRLRDDALFPKTILFTLCVSVAVFLNLKENQCSLTGHDDKETRS